MTPEAMSTMPEEQQQYVCTLSPEAKRLAQRDLSEEDHTRELALRQMRQWILTNPNITKCRAGGGIFFA